MLKLSLEKGKSYSRQVEAAAKFVSRLIEDASREGWARVWAYPRADSIMAGAALFSILSSAGARPMFAVRAEPPPRISVPTILVGYEWLDYGTGDVESVLAAFAPRIDRPPPPNTVYIDGDGSNAGLVGAVIAEMGGLYYRRDVMGLVVAGIHYGDRMDKIGKVYGVDEIVVENVLSSGVLGRAEVLTSVKVYKPLSNTVCRALSVTLNPYYPGFTGDREECARSLAALGLESLASRKVASLDREDLKLLVKGVVSRAQEETGREVDVREYVGSLIVSESGEPEDFRMLADSIVYALEHDGSPEPVIEAASSYEDAVPVLEKLLVDGAPLLASMIREQRPKRLRSLPWLRAYLLAPSPVPHTFAWRALVLAGLVDRESVIVYEGEDGELLASGLQIEAALGYGELRKLRNVKAVEGDGIRYIVRQREQ